VGSRGPAAGGKQQLGSGSGKLSSESRVPLLKVLEGVIRHGADSLLIGGHLCMMPITVNGGAAAGCRLAAFAAKRSSLLAYGASTNPPATASGV
jgi:hypothetical protein